MPRKRRHKRHTSSSFEKVDVKSLLRVFENKQILRLKKLFDTVDSNGKGLLTQQEFLKSYLSLFQNERKCTSSQCEQRFQEIDIDGDGKISFFDFLKREVMESPEKFLPDNVLSDLHKDFQNLSREDVQQMTENEYVRRGIELFVDKEYAVVKTMTSHREEKRDPTPVRARHAPIETLIIQAIQTSGILACDIEMDELKIQVTSLVDRNNCKYAPLALHHIFEMGHEEVKFSSVPSFLRTLRVLTSIETSEEVSIEVFEQSETDLSPEAASYLRTQKIAAVEQPWYCYSGDLCSLSEDDEYHEDDDEEIKKTSPSEIEAKHRNHLAAMITRAAITTLFKGSSDIEADRLQIEVVKLLETGDAHHGVLALQQIHEIHATGIQIETTSELVNVLDIMAFHHEDAEVEVVCSKFKPEISEFVQTRYQAGYDWLSEKEKASEQEPLSTSINGLRVAMVLNAAYVCDLVAPTHGQIPTSQARKDLKIIDSLIVECNDEQFALALCQVQKLRVEGAKFDDMKSFVETVQEFVCNAIPSVLEELYSDSDDISDGEIDVPVTELKTFVSKPRTTKAHSTYSGHASSPLKVTINPATTIPPPPPPSLPRTQSSPDKMTAGMILSELKIAMNDSAPGNSSAILSKIVVAIQNKDFDRLDTLLASPPTGLNPQEMKALESARSFVECVEHCNVLIDEAFENNQVRPWLLERAIGYSESIEYDDERIQHCRQFRVEIGQLELLAKQEAEMLRTDKMREIVEQADALGYSSEVINTLRTYLVDTPLVKLIQMQLQAAVKHGDTTRQRELTLCLKRVFFNNAGSFFVFDNYPAFRSHKKWADRKLLCLSRDTLARGMRTFTTEPIHAALTKLKGKDEDRAIKMFKQIMQFMGDLATVKDDVFQKAASMIRKCLKHPQLRNELFCQLVKQLTKNPSLDSIKKGWQLMDLALAFFAPDTQLENYLEVFIRTRAGVEGHDWLLQRLHESSYDSKAKRSSESQVYSVQEVLDTIKTEILALNNNNPFFHDTQHRTLADIGNEPSTTSFSSSSYMWASLSQLPTALESSGSSITQSASCAPSAPSFVNRRVSLPANLSSHSSRPPPPPPPPPSYSRNDPSLVDQFNEMVVIPERAHSQHNHSLSVPPSALSRAASDLARTPPPPPPPPK